METKTEHDRRAGWELAIEAFCLAVTWTLPPETKQALRRQFEENVQVCLAQAEATPISDAVLAALQDFRDRLLRASE